MLKWSVNYSFEPYLCSELSIKTIHDFVSILMLEAPVPSHCNCMEDSVWCPFYTGLEQHESEYMMTKFSGFC